MKAEMDAEEMEKTRKKDEWEIAVCTVKGS